MLKGQCYKEPMLHSGPRQGWHRYHGINNNSMHVKGTVLKNTHASLYSPRHGWVLNENSSIYGMKKLRWNEKIKKCSFLYQDVVDDLSVHIQSQVRIPLL